MDENVFFLVGGDYLGHLNLTFPLKNCIKFNNRTAGWLV